MAGGLLPNRTAGSNRQILICRQIVVHMAAMEAAPVALLQKQLLPDVGLDFGELGLELENLFPAQVHSL